jgi:hypothetical protein
MRCANSVTGLIYWQQRATLLTSRVLEPRDHKFQQFELVMSYSLRDSVCSVAEYRYIFDKFSGMDVTGPQIGNGTC